MVGRIVVVGLLFAIGCETKIPERVVQGGTCERDGQCATGRCVAAKCVPEEAFERSLLEQSGVAAPRAESEPAAPRGTPVRLRETRGEPPLFAACAADERLVGGGCSGGDNCVGQGCAYLRSYPSGDATDTIGGRWHCVGGRGDVRAHALCQLAR